MEGFCLKSHFINRTTLSKTIRFSLLPIGCTAENFRKRGLLDEDVIRAESCKRVKEYIDRYHRLFIEEVLSGLYLDGIQDYAALYRKSERNQEENDAMRDMEESYRRAIAEAFRSNPRFAVLFKKELIREILPVFLTEEEEKKAVEEFYEFTTYFTNFHQNRKNMYTDEEKATGIAFRCVNDNLPKFLDNALSFTKVRELLSDDVFVQLNADFARDDHITVEDMFSPDYFSEVLTQSGIDRYNEMLGGRTEEGQPSVSGLNQYINLYNQQIARPQKKPILPLMKPLYKQILSDRQSASFLPEQFARNDPDAVLSAIRECFCLPDGILNVISLIEKLFARLPLFDQNGIHVKNDTALTTVLQTAFEDWSKVKKAWLAEYESLHPRKKQSEEKYNEARQKAYKAIKSFSLAQITHYVGADTVAGFYAAEMSRLCEAVRTSYAFAGTLLANPYTDKKRLSSNESAVTIIKTLLDSVKEVERTLRLFLGSGKEAHKDEEFYGALSPILEALADFDTLYNKVRNFMTQKPYSVEKIKLNFHNPQLLGGWDKNKETDYLSVLLRKDGGYYLAIMDRSNKKVFQTMPVPQSDEDCYEKMEYKLLPGPEKMLPKVFFAKSKADMFPASDEVMRIYREKTFIKGKSFSLKDCHTLIDHYKICINRHPDWSQFGFRFSETSSYEDISGFFNEIAQQAYRVSFVPVPVSYIDSMVENGSLYLFRIYNKDFSLHSKGKKNLHTLYFQMLFDSRNLSNPVYKLSGGGEIFYRPASLTEPEEITVHPANQPIGRKQSKDGQTSLFPYDITKDKRYTQDHFTLHLPIQMNFKAEQHPEPLNLAVREDIRRTDDIHIIGIDRGERNLLYICMIDAEGRIEAQQSLNLVPGGNDAPVDYHALLDSREAGRTKARQDWATIDSIKELKSGYLSQAIHIICQWVMKHDTTLIAMENLNAGFMQSRSKVEKQVYQKFEKMLADKLSYLVDKEKECDEDGGLLRAYQLAEPMDETGRGKSGGRNTAPLQNGIIFYVPAWMTSKIDPVTGFAALLHPKYTSESEAADFIGRFDSIRYNASADGFEFELDYDAFPRCGVDCRKKWVVCTHGDRILQFRDSARNNEFSYRVQQPTLDLKNLLERYGIAYSSGENLKSAILSQASSDLFKELLMILKLMLQMRNSVPFARLNELGDTEALTPIMRQAVTYAKANHADVDYLISPVCGADGSYFDSRAYEGNPDAALPVDSDANGAYNIARKALWAVRQIKMSDDPKKARLSIRQDEWLKYAQVGDN